MYIRVHHSLIKSSPALSHQLLWAKQGVTYVEIFIDRFLIDMKENTPNTTLLNPIGNVSTKANLNWSFFLESTFLREKYINIIKNPHAIECILVELNKKWNWLPKTFPFLLGVSVGERTAGAQKTFIMFNMRSGRGGKLKQRSRRERQQSRGQPAPSVGVERQGPRLSGRPISWSGCAPPAVWNGKANRLPATGRKAGGQQTETGSRCAREGAVPGALCLSAYLRIVSSHTTMNIFSRKTARLPKKCHIV